MAFCSELKLLKNYELRVTSRNKELYRSPCQDKTTQFSQKYHLCELGNLALSLRRIEHTLCEQNTRLMRWSSVGPRTKRGVTVPFCIDTVTVGCDSHTEIRHLVPVVTGPNLCRYHWIVCQFHMKQIHMCDVIWNPLLMLRVSWGCFLLLCLHSAIFTEQFTVMRSHPMFLLLRVPQALKESVSPFFRAVLTFLWVFHPCFKCCCVISRVLIQCMPEGVVQAKSGCKASADLKCSVLWYLGYLGFFVWSSDCVQPFDSTRFISCFWSIPLRELCSVFKLSCKGHHHFLHGQSTMCATNLKSPIVSHCNDGNSQHNSFPILLANI